MILKNLKLCSKVYIFKQMSLKHKLQRAAPKNIYHLYRNPLYIEYILDLHKPIKLIIFTANITKYFKYIIHCSKKLIN